MRKVVLAGLIGLAGCSHATQSQTQTSRFEHVENLVVEPRSTHFVIPSSTNRGPSYPADQLRKRITGRVVVSFVIDLTGHAEPRTISWVAGVTANNQSFFRSVCNFLGTATYEFSGPAQRVLVTQPFEFNLTLDTAVGIVGSDANERGVVDRIESSSAAQAVKILTPLQHCS